MSVIPYGRMRAAVGRLKRRARAGLRASLGVKKYVKKAILKDKEMRHIAAAITPTYANGGGSTIALLNGGIAQGDDIGSRDGNQMVMLGMTLRILVNMATTTGDGHLRTLVVYDRFPDGALPTATNILNADNAQSVYAATGYGRFKVLYDSTKYLTDISKDCASFIVSKRFRLPIEYSGSGSTIASFRKGSIVILTVSQGTFAVANPTAVGTVEFWWREQ